MCLDGPVEFTEELLRILLISVDGLGAFPFNTSIAFRLTARVSVGSPRRLPQAAEDKRLWEVWAKG